MTYLESYVTYVEKKEEGISGKSMSRDKKRNLHFYLSLQSKLRILVYLAFKLLKYIGTDIEE